jgi:hypothetical protein
MTAVAFPNSQPRERGHLGLVARLNDMSVVKRYEAYRDVDWNAADASIDPRDPRFRLAPTSPLGCTDWYASLPRDDQARLGLEWTCQTLRFGISFESCLSRGLLEFAAREPNGSPLYRYAMHEVIEESHHSLMFQELINRSGCETHDVPRIERWLQRWVIRMGATFPEAFFLCVLSGEVFIDYDNRARLRDKEALHPLFRRVMQIHVTEEARHVSFAASFLRERVPLLPAYKRWVLRVLLLPAMNRGASMMLEPPPRLVRKYDIPADVLRETFGPTSAHRRIVEETTAPIRALLE